MVIRFNALDRAFARGLLAAALLVPAATWADAALRTAQIRVGAHPMKVEIVDTDPQRYKGLMFREKLGRDEGMLFIYDEPAYQSMWMKNTLIPLSVAFLDDGGAIINVEDMQPQTEDSHCASRPARYALEMNRGWFAARGIKPGIRIGGIPGVKH